MCTKDGEDLPVGNETEKVVASVGLADIPQVEVRGLRYKFVNFGAETGPGSRKW